MSAILLSAVISVVVIIIFQLLIKLLRVKYAYHGLPEPLEDKHWLLGHLPIFSNKIAGQSVVDKFLEWTAKYPRMYVLWFGPFDARVVLNHPDPIKKILKTSGHDTTASAISWILYSLAENPECQRKCQEEIDKVISETKSGQLEWKDLGGLEYLTQCIKEGMRLHSPVPGILRDIQSPLREGDHEIPARTSVLISINGLHHNPTVWGKDHAQFKPERFSPENTEERDSFAFCPFSAGPRNCIGQNFAMSEERTVLATLLQRFTFSVDKTHKVEKQISAVMRARYGIKLFAAPR